MADATSYDAKHWRKCLRQGVAIAEASLTTAGHLYPTYVVFADDGHYLVTPPPDADDARMAFVLVSLIACAHEAHAVLAISEAWTAEIVAPEGVDPRTMDRPRLSELPDKREVVFAVVVFRDASGKRQSILASHAIERGPAGNVTGLGLAGMADATGVGGNILRLIPEQPWPAEARTKAMAGLAKLPPGLWSKMP